MTGRWPRPAMAIPFPSDNDLIDQAIFLAYTKQSSIGWPHALCRHLCLHWGAAMSTYMQYRALYNTFKATQWTRALIWTMHEYTYWQWIDCNYAVHGATLTACRATLYLSLMIQITEANWNSSKISIDKLSITFGILLALQLEQTIITMEAWLLQYQAGQKHLALILNQESSKHDTITWFLISCTWGYCPDIPPG